ncbi:hypothetical protein GCM10010441_73550 [Kitasatospora paracochleata]|uniref:Uncharacterized protein n=1 Tax=Kitasatospora paracochleata TaxID=58354 RepID=A0ABT1J5L1_9ACTN|nr:hypothetical protein [Kitasatospora paracochleata]MCP2312720.1 hypothetical protein [Kitasatospora paracochleata]
MHGTVISTRVAIAPSSAFEAPAGALSVVDRRRPGQRYPRVAVRGLELNRLQVATAMLELSDHIGYKPSVAHLSSVLDWAVEAYGLDGLNSAARDMLHLSVAEDHNLDVAMAWLHAHTLVTSFWYTNAESRLMTRWERAVALHLAGEDLLPRRLLADYYAAKTPAAELSALVAHGASLVPVAELEDLAEELEREQNPFIDRPATGEERARRAALKGALPDYNRRRFCHHVADIHHRMFELSTPLVVHSDSGERFLGATVPDCPEMHIRQAAVYAAGRAHREARQKHATLASEAQIGQGGMRV